MDEGTVNYGQWGIVELMGHKCVAGLISKEEMLGKALLRVDVPATSAYAAYTQLYGEAAIYCVTFTSQEVAVRTAEHIKVNPVSVYVPDLVTRDQMAEMAEQYQKEIESLRNRLRLPAQSLPDEDEEDGENDYSDPEPRF